MKKIVIASVLLGLSMSANAYVEAKTEVNDRTTMEDVRTTYFNKNHVHIRNDSDETRQYHVALKFCLEMGQCQQPGYNVTLKPHERHTKDWVEKITTDYKYAGTFQQTAQLSISGAETASSYSNAWTHVQRHW